MISTYGPYDMEQEKLIIFNPWAMGRKRHGKADFHYFLDYFILQAKNARFGFYGYENPKEHLSSALQATLNFHALLSRRVRVKIFEKSITLKVLIFHI